MNETHEDEAHKKDVELLKLKQELSKRDKDLSHLNQLLRKYKRVFAATMFVIGSLLAIRCAPKANLPDPLITAYGTKICSGTSLFGTTGTALCTLAGNICSSATILGGTGSAICIVANQVMQSNANRDGSSTRHTTQITQDAEVTTYAGTASSPTLPSGYREIPGIQRDDDGYQTYTANSTYSQYGGRPQVSCGGTSFTTIAAKIADCQAKNGSLATYTGASLGLQGQATWYLVFSSGQATAGTCLRPSAGTNQYTTDCYEVWQDQKTGLLWSSSLTRDDGGSRGGSVNWCIASGNGSVAGQTATDPDSTDASGYCNSATYQNSAGAPWSSCVEVAPSGATLTAPTGFCNNSTTRLTPVACTGAGGTWTTNTLTPGSTTTVTEDYTAGIYSIAKGYLGALSNPGVRWRLPTKYDYQQADNDGIRAVMPDTGITADASYRNNDGSLGYLGSGFEWSASVNSQSRSSGRYYFSANGTFNSNPRTNPYIVRCVGR